MLFIFVVQNKGAVAMLCPDQVDHTLCTFPDGFKLLMLLNTDNDQTVYNDVFYASRPGLQTFHQPPDSIERRWRPKGFQFNSDEWRLYVEEMGFCSGM